MKIVTNSELSKIENGSLIIPLGVNEKQCRYNADIIDKIPEIFIGHSNDTYWNGIVYLHPFDDNYGLPFSHEDINSGKDIAIIDKDDIVFNVDTDKNDYADDALFIVYSNEEKQSFISELLNYLHYEGPTATIDVHSDAVGNTYYECSNCGNTWWHPYSENYCSECGAKIVADIKTEEQFIIPEQCKTCENLKPIGMHMNGKSNRYTCTKVKPTFWKIKLDNCPKYEKLNGGETNNVN